MSPLPESFAAWHVSPERQRHEWLKTRKSIVAARMRIVVIGHALVFFVCVLVGALNGFGLPAGFASGGCWSLCFISVGLLGVEWMHIKLRPRTPPRFVVRHQGLTEYGEDGPRAHWDWQRAWQLAIETDRERPGYRSLVLAIRDPFLRARFSRFYFPLPDSGEAGGEMDERKIVAAVDRALRANCIVWKACVDGSVTLDAQKD